MDLIQLIFMIDINFNKHFNKGIIMISGNKIETIIDEKRNIYLSNKKNQSWPTFQNNWH